MYPSRSYNFPVVPDGYKSWQIIVLAVADLLEYEFLGIDCSLPEKTYCDTTAPENTDLASLSSPHPLL